jgi:hypothetical protein
MTRVTLHIGTHKTGTTFLQCQLEAQRAQLAAQGVHYLSGGPNHSWITLAFCDEPEAEHAAMRRGLIGRDSARAWAKERREQLAQEIAGCRLPRVLISGEDICRMPEHSIQALVETLRQQGCEIDVLCCVREPVGYATSDAQESIKGGFTWEEALACPCTAHFRPSLACFARLLGRDAVRVFPFLPSSDDRILADFAACAELDLGRVEAGADNNRSLTAEAAYLLSEINRSHPMFLADRTNPARAPIPSHWLQAIGRRKFALPPDRLETALDGLRDDYAWLREFTGCDWFDAAAPADPDWQPLSEETRRLLHDFAGILHGAAQSLDQTVVAFLLQSAEFDLRSGDTGRARQTLDRLKRYKPSEAAGQRLLARVEAESGAPGRERPPQSAGRTDVSAPGRATRSPGRDTRPAHAQPLP